jgi:hypothetical protein
VLSIKPVDSLLEVSNCFAEVTRVPSVGFVLFHRNTIPTVNMFFKLVSKSQIVFIQTLKTPWLKHFYCPIQVFVFTKCINLAYNGETCSHFHSWTNCEMSIGDWHPKS